jgi:transposase
METTDDPPDDPEVRRRVDVLTHLRDGTIHLGQAAAILRVSDRQVRRLLSAWLEHGPTVLVHGNRGRAPVNRTDEDLRTRIRVLVADRYRDVNRAHLAELLDEREGITIPVRTLRRILDESAQPVPRPHRPPRHRSRRPRMERAGQLLQADGSKHRWCGPDLPFATLVGAIDDATSMVTGLTFRAQEDAAGYLEVLTQTSRGPGLPWTFYTDHHGIFERDPRVAPTMLEQLAGERERTQVGRALLVAGIGWLPASSPEAKGRVERLWGTAQDRLVTELRLEGITTIAGANAYLPGWLIRHNARFAVPAADPVSAWRAWPEGHSAEAVFAFWYRRTVARDNTVSWEGRALSLPRRSDGRSRAGREITVAERLDGSLWVELEGIWQPLVDAPPSAPELRARKTRRAGATTITPAQDGPVEDDRAEEPPPSGTTTAPWRPAPGHPWRRRLKPG